MNKTNRRAEVTKECATESLKRLKVVEEAFRQRLIYDIKEMTITFVKYSTTTSVKATVYKDASVMAFTLQYQGLNKVVLSNSVYEKRPIEEFDYEYLYEVLCALCDYNWTLTQVN